MGQSAIDNSVDGAVQRKRFPTGNQAAAYCQEQAKFYDKTRYIVAWTGPEVPENERYEALTRNPKGCKFVWEVKPNGEIKPVGTVNKDTY